MEGFKMKKITQKDVDKAWGKVWEDRDKAQGAWDEARKLERKFEEQEGLK